MMQMLKRFPLAFRTFWAILRHGERRARVGNMRTVKAPKPGPRPLDGGVRLRVQRNEPRYRVVCRVGREVLETYGGDNAAKARSAFKIAQHRHDVSGAAFYEGGSPRNCYGQAEGL